jgi:hypothetical protein
MGGQKIHWHFKNKDHTDRLNTGAGKVVAAPNEQRYLIEPMNRP